MTKVRTRFAPSPTGHLHIGGARTALFNHLFARHNGGTFILRIEDTDRARSTEEYLHSILDAMKWLGLDWDEGPFFQTQRFDLYREHAERLLAASKLYRCYCTAEELEAKREAAMREKRNPAYDRTCRNLHEPVAGKPYSLRLKAPLDGETIVRDLVRGNVIFPNTEIDDLILVRSDGTPTYNFCVVVDDALMEITHNIRGEDHLVNTPKQIQLYRAFGYPEPQFAHVPMILGADRARLSKRHGATSVLAYRDEGYLPDALVNYLVRLGWSSGDQEVFTRAELVEKFSLENLGVSAAAFNPEKALWLNFQYLKALPIPELAALTRPFLERRGYAVPEDPAWLEKMVTTLRERANTLEELAAQAHFYFGESIELDPEAAGQHLTAAIREALMDLRQELAPLSPWDHDSIHAAFGRVTEKHGIKLGKLAQPVRVAVTGGTKSPGIFEVLELLGRERSIARLDQAIARIG